MITTSDGYYHNVCDVLDDCERAYCRSCRLLFRVCETAMEGWEGDRDVVGGLNPIVEVTGNCPQCH